MTFSNQADRLPDHDAYAEDVSLQWWLHHGSAAITAREAVAMMVGGSVNAPEPAAHADATTEHDHDALLSAIGVLVGGHHHQDLADRANRFGPQLDTHTRTGDRIDMVRFDSSWDELLRDMIGSGVVGMARGADGSHALRTAAFELWSRLDVGAVCPISMTAAAIPLLEHWDGPDSEWTERLSSADADVSALAGMALTELHGGSDLSGSTTAAMQVESQPGAYRLTGRKWFCSHPVSDVLIVLARDPDVDGLSCFVVPGWRADGSRNGIRIERLKDKLGTRSLASGEIRLEGAEARLIGPAGGGVRTIIEMVNQTRLDCATGSTGVMTRAVGEAITYARQREAFGAPLIEQPLMRMVLADLALEREASLALTMACAHALDAGDPLTRLLTICAKFWIPRRSAAVAVEALECLGGNGYTEDWVLARLVRDAPVNTIWEGAGNVIALDLLRAIGGSPDLVREMQGWIDILLRAGGVGMTFANDIASARDFPAQVIGSNAAKGPIHARLAVTRWAQAAQAALLCWRADQTGDIDDSLIAAAYVATRLQHRGDRPFGAGGPALEMATPALIARADVAARFA